MERPNNESNKETKYERLVLPRENVDIQETRTFSKEEIINLLCKIDGIKQEDLIQLDSIMDDQGNIIDVYFELKPEIAYQKFGKPAEYAFHLKSSYELLGSHNSSENETTEITRLLKSEEDKEIEQRILDRAKDPEEKLYELIMAVPKEHYVIIATFIDGEWVIG